MLSYDMRLPTPFNMLVVGPSKSGKTSFVTELVHNAHEMFTVKPVHTILFFSQRQESYEAMLTKNLVNEMINIETATVDADELNRKVLPYKDLGGSLIIFDDTMAHIREDFAKLFTVVGHHTNCSLIFISQNLFHKNRFYRDMSLNFDFITLLKTARDKLQIATLGKQICPGNSQYITSAYNDATKEPYSHLLIDCSSAGVDKVRVRSKIFNPMYLEDVLNEMEPYTVYINTK